MYDRSINKKRNKSENDFERKLNLVEDYRNKNILINQMALNL